jgi:hypothetical protein
VFDLGFEIEDGFLEVFDGTAVLGAPFLAEMLLLTD